MLLAHSLGTAADTIPGFLWLGVVHMLRGWDHLLFIGGVVLLAGRPGRAATMLSAFAAGHSITLFTASVAGWRVSAELVDVVIGLSVVFVGVVAVKGPPRDWTLFAAVVGAFGLVHGLGLSTRLQALGLPSDDVIARVLAFNVGVELGQLTVVAAVYAAGLAVRRWVSWPALPRVAAGALIAGGLAAAVLVPVTATGELPFAQGRSKACTVYGEPAAYPTGAAGPATPFTAPGDMVNPAAYGFALAQGFVVVRFQPELPAAELAELRTWMAAPGMQRVLAGPAQQPAPITASTAERSLRCTAFDSDALRHFAGDWLGRPASRR